ncbi:hypothetical protein [Albidovulum sp.]
MKTQRRWMARVLSESAKQGPALPWHRAARQPAARSRPALVRVAPAKG